MTEGKTNGLGDLAHISFTELQQYMREEFPDAIPQDAPDDSPREPRRADDPSYVPAATAGQQRRIVIGTLSYDGKMHCKHAYSLMQAAFAVAKEGWELSFVLREGDSMVARGRNVLIAKFLEDPKNTDLFLVDTDLEFRAEDFIRLCKAPVDVVAGCYPFKDGNGQFPLRWPVDGLFEENGLWEVWAVTPGFFRVTRNALERMVRQLPYLAYVDNAVGVRGTSFMLFDNLCRQNGVYDEGYVFCEHWRTVGGKVWIDPKCNLTHIGTIAYNHGTVVDWLERTAKNTEKLKADFPHVPDLNLIAFATKREPDYEAAAKHFNADNADAGKAGTAQENAGIQPAAHEPANLEDITSSGRGRPTDLGLLKTVTQGLATSGVGQAAGGYPGAEERPRAD